MAKCYDIIDGGDDVRGQIMLEDDEWKALAPLIGRLFRVSPSVKVGQQVLILIDCRDRGVPQGSVGKVTQINQTQKKGQTYCVKFYRAGTKAYRYISLRRSQFAPLPDPGEIPHHYENTEYRCQLCDDPACPGCTGKNGGCHATGE